ncbi:MAG: hypothetical protein F4Z31_20940 [Gemmatimonadetes bacterium]|nr:hypothetical protein [Gemmatimonadota bacterium]MYE91737.1 hypothetical protein [Gemmatimonadota bacterium]MYJ09990.1 hypothetical protein [Gemmatimonadota bacterium]
MNIEESRAGLEKHMLAQADSVGELLEQFRSRISPELIDGPGWDRLLRRARALPISLATSGFGFELPLHEPELRADLGVALFDGSLSAAHFEEWCRAQPDEPSTAPAFRLLRTMGREPAIQQIGGTKLMLEYDIDPGRAGPPPDPGIFLYPAADVVSSKDSVRGLEGFLAAAAAVAAAAGWTLEATERRQIERLFSAMPPDTHVGSVGAFPSRSDGLRIAVTGFRKTRDFTDFLERTDWPGRPEAVAPFLSEMEERDAFAHLAAHFDIPTQGGLGPALGVSFHARDVQWVKDVDPWMELIDGVGEHGLALRDKLSALATAWSGAEAVFGRRSMLLLVKGIHHIKLVVSDGRFTQAKAYVFVLMLPPFPAASATGR